MYLIKKGSIAIRKKKGGGQVELARVYANEVIGELAFFDRQPRSASATALTEVEVLEISFASLDQIWAKVPDYLKTIMKAVAERLRKANNQIKSLQKNIVEEATDGDEEGSAASGDAAAILAHASNVSHDIAGRDISAPEAETGADSEAALEDLGDDDDFDDDEEFELEDDDDQK